MNVWKYRVEVLSYCFEIIHIFYLEKCFEVVDVIESTSNLNILEETHTEHSKDEHNKKQEKTNVE